jgi:hypothetical protein
MKHIVYHLVALLSCHFAVPPVCADDFAARCVDRAAIERVYHSHRTGTTQPFEVAMPQTLLEKMVLEDRRKEAALKQVYGMEITPAMVEAEVQRINTTTRAPEVLAEIKHALGDDAARFARAMARPIVVERTLRSRFENDDALHAPQRKLADDARTALLAAKNEPLEKRIALLKSSASTDAPAAVQTSEMTWQLAPRPDEEVPRAAAPVAPTKNTARAGPYTNESTAQIAQSLTPPAKAESRDKHYFSDLPADLQNVLRAQLTKPGDVSAVIESGSGFSLFFCREKTDAVLSAQSLTIPKRSYEEWLAAQSANN